MKRKATNWQRFFNDQMRNREFRAFVEAELRALRVGAKIATLRQRRKVSQTKLAALTGMSAPNISRIENDPSPNLTLETLTRIGLALGHDVQIIFRPRSKVSPSRAVRSA